MLKSIYTYSQQQQYRHSPYKSQTPFETRISDASRILVKYPDRVPIICEPTNTQPSANLPIIDKNKYLVPNDLTIGQFLFVIRKRLKMYPEQALYLFIDGTIPPTSEMISNIYHTYKDADGFLYMTYNCENTFGWGS